MVYFITPIIAEILFRFAKCLSTALEVTNEKDCSGKRENGLLKMPKPLVSKQLLTEISSLFYSFNERTITLSILTPSISITSSSNKFQISFSPCFGI